MAIEAMHEKTEEAMCKLLQALFRSFVITIDQMKKVRFQDSNHLSMSLTLLPWLSGVRESV